MKNFTYGILALAMLSACSQEVDLTYNCVPSGATVYEEGIGQVGTCPVTLKYNTNDVKISDGEINVDPIRVIWLSGASIMVAPAALQIPEDNKITLTFMHPENTLDYERDKRFGLAYEQSLPTPQERYITSTNQYKSIFDGFNNTFTCAFRGAIGDVYSQCP